ncbi:MAG TPA: FKBP-type peptidyl-prolyl cis-trans isomerase [Opitutaceae bacterium]
MRFPKIAFLGIAALTGAVLNAQEMKPNSEPTEAPTFTDEQAVEAFGWFLAHQSGLVALGFTKEEIEVMGRGMALAVTGQPSPHEFEKIGPTIQALIAKRKESALTKMREQGVAESTQFMTEIRAKAGVVSMDNGMAYEVISEGTGPKPRADQWVKVNYVGKLISGAVFDRSEEGKPVEFGLDGVIDGWREGLQQVNQGSKVILYIPPQLAYGDQGSPEIPPASTLIFEVELLEVKDAPPAEPAVPAPAPEATPAPVPAPGN